MRTDYPPDLERLSVEGYLVRERAAEYRSDYVYGRVRAMSGASLNHGRITMNVGGLLVPQLKGKRCEPISNEVRIQVDPKGLYVYPDVSVVCGAPEMLDSEHDVLLNPTVIFEVLSPSTEAYDRGLKSIRYREVPSLREYVLIAQDRPLVERFTREADGVWVVETFEGLTATVPLPSIGCTLPLADLYDRVAFDPG